MKKTGKKIGGAFILIVLFLVLFFLSALPGNIVKPETWTEFCSCFVAFVVIFLSGLYGIVIILSKFTNEGK